MDGSAGRSTTGMRSANQKAIHQPLSRLASEAARQLPSQHLPKPLRLLLSRPPPRSARQRLCRHPGPPQPQHRPRVSARVPSPLPGMVILGSLLRAKISAARTLVDLVHTSRPVADLPEAEAGADQSLAPPGNTASQRRRVGKSPSPRRKRLARSHTEPLLTLISVAASLTANALVGLSVFHSPSRHRALRTLGPS